jgi:ribosomal protection tetracycline resistance protein
MISESVLHKRYQSQVIRLIQKYLQVGKYGWELTDIRVELVDAAWDSVGSKQLHFNIATPIALARAITDAGTRLLEPIMEYVITLNKDYFDKVMTILIHFTNASSDISTLDNGRLKIVGDAYISEIDVISKNLKRVTSGDATLEYYQKGYTYAIDDTMHKNRISSQFNPYDISTFVKDMGGSTFILDKRIKK